MVEEVRSLKKRLKRKGLLMGLECLSPEEEAIIQKNLLYRLKRSMRK